MENEGKTHSDRRYREKALRKLAKTKQKSKSNIN